MSGEPGRRRLVLSRAGAEAAAAAIVHAAIRRSSDQTAETLRIREVAQQLAERYRNVGLPQRA